ncbi:MAG: T9SS type A sorting domain-containing protein [Bacteroidota bacterium]|nr:T9SS type A sorting domain-containing protein [Bacteroidota bacterium]
MKLLIFLFAFLFGIYAIGQNLVPNHSFEAGLGDWIQNGDVHPQVFGPGNLVIQKDIFSTSTDLCGKHFNIDIPLTVPENYFGYQHAWDGQNYAGIWAQRGNGGCGTSNSNERGLLGIKLTEELKQCQYFIQFRWAKMDNSQRDPEIEIMLSKSINNSNSPVSTQTIASRTVVNKSWTTSNFVFTPDDTGYEYLFFKTTNWSAPYSYYLTGIYLDDISLNPHCVTCSRTSGCINPISNNVHVAYSAQASGSPPNNYLKFWNLDNVRKAELYIYNIYSQLISSSGVISENGISNPIYWDGKNNNGAEMAPSTYLYRLHIWNDCGKAQVFSNSFVKSHFGSGPSNYPPVYEYNDIKTPKPCCQNDIYVDNITLEGPGVIEYHAVNNVFIGNNVTIAHDAVVIFRAGNEIVGNPFQNSFLGADIIAEIIPCGENERLMADNNEDDIEKIFDTLIKYDNDIEELTTINSEAHTGIENGINKFEHFNIYPNPSNGTFTIVLPYENLKTDIVVYDAMGKISFQTITTGETNINIDLTGFTPGLYFVKISNGEIVKMKKVVYSK